MIVDVGIACNKNQPHQRWGRVMGELLRVQERGVVKIGRLLYIGGAQPDWVKNKVAQLFIAPAPTSENRNQIVAESDGDAIWWLDDDTVPPAGALEQLLERRVEIAAGVYYRRSAPFNPMVYRRMPNGTYAPMWEWQTGEVIQEPGLAVGMGCTLVRREAYERIRDGHVLFKRKGTGTLVAVQREAVIPSLDDSPPETGEQRRRVEVRYGRPYLVEELTPVVDPDEQWFPFYMMEYQRTEDLYFCELAAAVGCRVAVDTSIECEHWGLSPVTGEDFRQLHAAVEGV